MKRQRKPGPAIASPVYVAVPDFPIHQWRLRRSGRSVQTVTVRQEDGRYLAVIAENPEIRFAADTFRKAQNGVLRRLELRNDGLTEDEADSLVADRRKSEPTISLAEYRRRRAL